MKIIRTSLGAMLLVCALSTVTFAQVDENHGGVTRPNPPAATISKGSLSSFQILLALLKVGRIVTGIF